MNPVRVFIIVIAAVAAIGLAFVMRGAFGGKAQTTASPAAAPTAAQTARVLVAKRDLAVGERLQASDLGWQDWPADALNPTLITDGAAPSAADKTKAEQVAVAAGDMIGGAGPMQAYVNAIVREPMLTGEPIMARKLVRAGEGGFLSVVVASGKRAIAVPITVESGAGGFILPGDRVDVVQSHEADAGPTAEGGSSKTTFVADTLMTNVRVLAIDQATAAAKGAQSMIGSTATLEVAPSDAEVLIRAKAQGPVMLTLRSITDAGAPSGATGGSSSGDAGVVRVHRAGVTQTVGVRQ